MKEILKKIDWRFAMILTALLLTGLLALYSASHQKQLDTGKNFLLNQAVWIAIGSLILVFFSRVNYRAFLSVAYILYGLNIILLLIVLVMGKTALGAQRWIGIGGIRFQPSEFAKIFSVLALARYLGDNPRSLKSAGGLVIPIILFMFPMGLIFLQPDLGTALVFLPALLAMLLVAGIRIKHLLGFLGSGLAVLPLGWGMLKAYQKDRLLVFLNPDLDPLGAGYTINQSKIAVGSGMFIGKGWFSGTQNRLNFLPERHTDFIFSVIGEEWGFVGAAAVVGLFLLLILRGLKIAELTKDFSGRLICVGMITLLAFHVIINIGMTLGLMPVVGMPLPFLSYGGSALITNLAAAAFLFNVKINRSVF